MNRRAGSLTTVAHEPLDDVEVALARLGRLLSSRQAASRLVEVAGVAVSQQGVVLLRALRRSGQVPAAALAAAAGMDLAAVSRQVRVLEEAGLVCRSADPDDGRVVRLDLTPDGRVTAERLHHIGARHLEQALATWSEDERARLATALTRLVDDLVATPLPRPTGP